MEFYAEKDTHVPNKTPVSIRFLFGTHFLSISMGASEVSWCQQTKARLTLRSSTLVSYGGD
jgi:hypothetical protein